MISDIYHLDSKFLRLLYRFLLLLVGCMLYRRCLYMPDTDNS